MIYMWLDLVIADLADDAAAFVDGVETYRLVLSEALTALHHVTRERDRLRLAGRRDVAEILGDQTDTIAELRHENEMLREELRGRVGECFGGLDPDVVEVEEAARC